MIVGVVASLALAAGTMQGCGGSGGTSDVALCEQVCDKGLACTPDAGAEAMAVAMQCKQSCPSTVASSQSCSNHAARVSAFQSCLAMDCAGFAVCVTTTIPPCQGGTAGNTGGGGTTGTGGTGGGSGASCDLCTKADSCCVAVGGTTQQCVLAQTCNAANAETRASVLIACQGVLDQARMLSNPPAACQ